MEIAEDSLFESRDPGLTECWTVGQWREWLIEDTKSRDDIGEKEIRELIENIRKTPPEEIAKEIEAMSEFKLEKVDDFYIVSSKDCSKDLQNIFNVEEGYSFKQLKEKYAEYLDKTYPNAREFPAIDGLNGCDINDVLGQIKNELGVDFIHYERYKKNTNDIKKDICEFFEKLATNRDKNYDWYRKEFPKTEDIYYDRIEYGQKLWMDVHPDRLGSFVCSLMFSNKGKEFAEVPLIDDTSNLEVEVLFNTKEIVKFFNDTATKFNEIQDAAREIRKTVKTRDLVQAAELVCAINKYMCSPYGAGEDYSYMEIAKFVNENKGKFVDLAYTELGDKNQHIVQVTYDLNTNKYKYEVNGVDVTSLTRTLEPKDNNLEQFIQDMEVADFDDVISECYDILEYVYGEEWWAASPDEYILNDVVYQEEKKEYKEEEMAYEIKDMTQEDHKEFRKEVNASKVLINSKGEKVALTEEEAKYFENKYKKPQHDSIESNRNVGDGVVGKSVEKGR